MYHDTEHYRLRFEKAERSISGTPELILSCHARQLPIITRRLAILRERMQPDADQYLNQAHTECSLPEPDLFGHIQFGYDKCAYICKQDETASLHFPLQQSRLLHTAFTLQLIKISLLATGPEDVPLGNQSQQCDLDFCTDRFREHGYGHAVGGHLASSVTTWLEAYRTHDTTERYFNGDAPMPELVITAMQETWQAIARESWQEYQNECNGRIGKDGAFILECFGNACDIGVYQSEFSRDMPFHKLSCHNLDTAEQQLTLLAGLATICQLARGEN